MAPSGPFRRAFAVTLRAALVACVFTATFDLIATGVRATQPLTTGAWLRGLTCALGLYFVATLVLALVVATVAGSVLATFPGAGLKPFLTTVRGDAERDRDQAAAILATALAAGLLGALVFGYAFAIGFEMAVRRNGALSTAMVACAALPVCAAAWFPLYRAARRAVVVLPRPRTLLMLYTLALVMLTGVVAAVGSVDWRAIDFGPIEAFLVVFASGAACAAFFYGSARGRRLKNRARVATRRALVLSTAVALTICLVVTWTRFGGDPRSLSLVSEESMGAKLLLRLARRFADRDHDGFAGRLGGGDCNDHDPRVHPGAEEIRGNGIDEDCDGADLPPVAMHSVADTRSAAAEKLSWKGNLLVITVDSLRADRLNARTMPRTWAVAEKGVVFTHAYAQAPNTPRSFPSFLTSRFPSEVKWLRMVMNFPPILDVPENTSFFEPLRSAGLHTVGVFSHFYMKPDYGIARGFDDWDNTGALSLHESNTDSAAPRITARVIAQLARAKKKGGRFAIWTHLFEPHSRYMDHDEFPAHGSGMAALESKYDGEVRFADKYIGEMIDALVRLGLADDTAIVVFSDHGEAFGEHRFGGERMYFHGQTLYDELLRVPFLVAVPGVAPRTIDGPVMLIDLGPTLCDLVKAPRPPSFHGRSLLGAMLGDALPPHPAYAELLPTPSWNHLWRAVVDGKTKLIYKISENSTELYDLSKDATEQLNLSGESGGEMARMRELLRTFLHGATRG